MGSHFKVSFVSEECSLIFLPNKGAIPLASLSNSPISLTRKVGAFGSFIGADEFAAFQVPFESQFEGWSGGSKNNGLTKHFTRFGDGNYACSGGWPSLIGINVKSFLGQGPTIERVFMRVCDWCRRENESLLENWVFVDVQHALLQLGYDPLPLWKKVKLW